MNNSKMFEHLLREIDKIKRRQDYATRAEVPRPFSGCRAVLSAAQSINDATWTAINFVSSETFDTHGMHSLVTNSNRFTAVIPGYYMMIGEVNWAGAGGTAQTWARIYKGGVTVLATFAHDWTSAVEFYDQVSAIYYLAAAEYVDLAVWHNTGSARNVSTATFTIAKIG